MQCKLRHSVAFVQWRQYFSKARSESPSGTQMADNSLNEIAMDLSKSMKRRYDQLVHDVNLNLFSDESLKYSYFYPNKKKGCYDEFDKHI